MAEVASTADEAVGKGLSTANEAGVKVTSTTDGAVAMAMAKATSMAGDFLSKVPSATNLLSFSRRYSFLARSSITIGDAVALAGAEAINAVGGPLLPTQLGRTEVAAKAPVPASMPPLNLFTGEVDNSVVADAFRSSGLTEREMTALLGCLLSVDSIEKATPAGNWKESQRPKFREAGKLGRASEFKPLSDEDIANELAKDGADDDEESYTVSGESAAAHSALVVDPRGRSALAKPAPADTMPRCSR